MILFPLLFFFSTRISAENLCLTWLFLSTEASPVVGKAPSHWAELGVWHPLFIPKLLPMEAPPQTGKCSEMHDSHSHRPVRKMHTEKILTWLPREHQVLFLIFVPGCFEVVCTKPREFKSLQQFLNSSLLRKHSPVVCAVGPLWDKQETKWNKNEEGRERGRLNTERRTK